MEELLSIKLRPKSLNDIIGQEHLVGENKIIYNLVKNKKFSINIIIFAVRVAYYVSKSHFNKSEE